MDDGKMTDLWFAVTRIRVYMVAESTISLLYEESRPYG